MVGTPSNFNLPGFVGVGKNSRPIRVQDLREYRWVQSRPGPLAQAPMGLGTISGLYEPVNFFLCTYLWNMSPVMELLRVSSVLVFNDLYKTPIRLTVAHCITVRRFLLRGECRPDS